MINSMKKYYFILLTFLIAITPLFLSVQSSDDLDKIIVDYIFTNSNILTVDDTNSISQAIAINNGKILALGNDEDILQLYFTENDTCYNMEGRTIMPGIIDGHSHYMASLFWIGEKYTIYDAQSLALAYGYTTLNEKSIDHGELSWLQSAEQNGTLRLRINCFLIYNFAWLEDNEPVPVGGWEDAVPINDHNKKLRIPGFKIYADGASGNRGFPAVSDPYTQEMMDEWGIINPYGDLYFNQTELNPIVDELYDRGFSVAFHAMGDRATETVLNAIEYALNDTSNDLARHQLEHNSFIREDLIARALSLDTIHSVRGYFPTYWQAEYEALYSTSWLERYANRYSLPSEGLHSYLETDFSYLYGFDEDDWSRSANIRPFLHVWGLVTRKAIDENGTIHTPNPWLAEHEITVEQALRMMTIEGAYAVGQEDYIGSLEVGKYADLIVISDDPLTTNQDNIKDIEVLLTMIDGTIEFLKSSHSFPVVCENEPTGTNITFWTTFLTIFGLIIVRYIRKPRMKK
jgi:predicted amidohydrolase YtcJ